LSPVRVLPDSVVNLISAGEVVDRPASVVKELVENALDAGASSIRVELEQGGRKSVIVRDDGCGMNRHDLLLAIQRHATSKIASEKDLESISTLGFRGEALPSIAAVSHFTIVTCDGDEAWKMDVDGGVISEVRPAARTRGTTVTVRNLFYNQPARKKFLRSRATELGWVERFVTGCALARTDVEFTLLHDGKILFTLGKNETVPGRLISRYGLSPDSRFMSASGETGGTSVTVVWFPGSMWNRRTHQYVLVNGRLVQTGLLYGTLDSALAGPAGYPLLYCGVTVPGELVDVNVHPSKREVKFRKPSMVLDVLKSALAGVLDQGRTAYGAEIKQVSGRPESTRLNGGEYDGRLFETAMEIRSSFPDYGHSRRSAEDLPVVQVGKAYLVTSTDRGIVLIDQHAAHERILYEIILESMEGSRGSQVLLLPENVELDSEEIRFVEEYARVLEGTGFEFHLEGNRLVLTAVPQGMLHGIEALREIIRSLRNPGSEAMPAHKHVAAAAACAGAVKFGDSLAPAEARHLVDMLFSTDDPFHCPHGRPTLLELTYEELDRKFGR